MLLLPSATHEGGEVVIAGTAGVANCAATLNEALAPELQLPSSASTV